MAWIALEGMRFRAFHGVYPPEQVLGTDYVVDVQVQADITTAAKLDDVECTVNYETIHRICQIEMDTPRKLIETVVHNIIREIKKQFPNLMALRVRVRKEHPPLGGRVDASWVEEESSFMSLCPRCGSPLVCYHDDTCWCRENNIHPATKEAIKKQFKTCLCSNCVRFFAG